MTNPLRSVLKISKNIAIGIGTISAVVTVTYSPKIEQQSTFALCYQVAKLGTGSMDAFEEVVRRGENCEEYKAQIAAIREMDAHKDIPAIKDENFILPTVDHDNAD
jgi:hypothetical protein